MRWFDLAFLVLFVFTIKEKKSAREARAQFLILEYS